MQLYTHTYLFPLPIWQKVDFDVGVGGATDVHGRQVLALHYRHVEDTTSEIVLHLPRTLLKTFLINLHNPKVRVRLSNYGVWILSASTNLVIYSSQILLLLCPILLLPVGVCLFSLKEVLGVIDVAVFDLKMGKQMDGLFCLES